MDYTPFDSLDAVVVVIHKVHSGSKDRWIAFELNVSILHSDASVVLILITVHGLQESFECKPIRGMLFLEVFFELQKGFCLRNEARSCILTIKILS